MSGDGRVIISDSEVSSSPSMHLWLYLNTFLDKQGLGHNLSIPLDPLLYQSWQGARIQAPDMTWNIYKLTHLPARNMSKSTKSGQVEQEKKTSIHLRLINHQNK